MNRMLLILSLGLCFGLFIILTGCSGGGPEPVEQESLSAEAGRDEQQEPEEAEPEEQAYVDPLTERYFDYVAENGHIGVLLGNEMEGEGFSDDEIAAYVIGEFIKLDAYEPGFGIARQAFDAVSERYFGRVLSDYETGSSTVLGESGYIAATGWDVAGIAMVLKDYVENEDGSITAVFYQVSLEGVQPGRTEILAGRMEGYGQVRLIELDFEEREALDGTPYWKYLAVRPLDVVQGPFAPYGSQQ